MVERCGDAGRSERDDQRHGQPQRPEQQALRGGGQASDHAGMMPSRAT
jgi:hypothetical protein